MGAMVVELKSETVEDVDVNCERILEWTKTWREERDSQQNGQQGKLGGSQFCVW